MVVYFFAAGAGAGVAACDRSISRCILPPCRMNFFVGENSPSRCPTISSLTRTSMKSFPLCTPNTYPTISGEISEARDHVLMIVPSPAFDFASFATRLGSTNGPFLADLDIVYFLILLFTMHLVDHFFR